MIVVVYTCKKMVQGCGRMKPLDLEKVWDDIREYLFLENSSDVALEKTLLEHPFTHEDLQWLLKKISERVRSACEFYLKYKDDPMLLLNEYRDKYEEIKVPEGVEFYPPGVVKCVDTKKYNAWLFKLAFKDIFKEEFK